MSFNVIVTISVIPPRVKDGSLYAFLDSIVKQTAYSGIKHIVINYCREYKRFNNESIPEHYRKAVCDYNDRVIWCENEIDSPLIKHIGPLNLYEEEEREKIISIVLDDDQEYHPTLIENMLMSMRMDYDCAYQNRAWGVCTGDGGFIHGFVGCAYRLSLLKHMGGAIFPLPDFDIWTDDQLMSIYFHKMGIRILPTIVHYYDHIFSSLENGHEKVNGDTGLHNHGSRDKHIKELCHFYKVKFINRHDIINGRGQIISLPFLFE